MKYRFLFLFIFLSIPCFSQITQTLSLEQSAILRVFFQTLTKESEAGYVFFNKKPVCIHGYFCKNPFVVKSDIHKQAVALREGAFIWKQLADKNSDLIVHICDKEDSSIPGYIHVLVINVPLFHRVVNENLSLFRYVLGPTVTSHDLLEALLSNNQTFHALLRDDKVLIGKILGFGEENSLYVSRMENIQEEFEKDIPPFLNSESLIQDYTREYLPIKPSFGFKSVREELDDFQEKIALSSEKLIQKDPEFIFGWLKDSKKTKEFISELEITQDKIQKLLTSSTFLEKILAKLTGKKYFLDKSQKFEFLFENNEINKIVAKGIWENIREYDFEYLPYFIEGLEKPASQQSKTDRLAWFPSYRREFIEGKENLQKADEVFKSLENGKDFQCIVPQKNYYKILKKGYGKTECNGPLVLLSYSIFSPLGHCLANQENVCLNLKNTIPGFSCGIKGMKVGETREIVIHPSLAYGFDTSLEKCIHLRAIVTLADFYDNEGYTSYSDCIDLSFLMDSEFMKTRDENYKIALVEKGAEIAKHLKKCKEIDLDLIADYLKHFYSNKEVNYSTTQIEQSLINKVHWNIYYGKGSI